MMYKLSFTNTAHVRPLLEVSSLMPPQTFNPGKALITNVTTVRLLSSVNVLMPPQVAQVFEAKAAAVTDIRFFTGVDPLMDFEVLFLSESFTTAAAFVRTLSCVDVVVDFEMRDVRKDSAADLTLVKLFLALQSSFAAFSPLLPSLFVVNVFTITFLMDHIVPVRLEPFTANLAFKRFVIASM